MIEQIVQCVKDTRVVAIIRGMAPEICVKLAEAYRSGGIRMVEVTFVQTDDLRKTAEAIRAIRAAAPLFVSVGGGIRSMDAIERHRLAHRPHAEEQHKKTNKKQTIRK